jgi:hypothetical protein
MKGKRLSIILVTMLGLFAYILLTESAKELFRAQIARQIYFALAP